MTNPEPNHWERRVIAKAKKTPLIQTFHVERGMEFTVGSSKVSIDVALSCIRNGWLKPNNDGLFDGSSQTFVPS